MKESVVFCLQIDDDDEIDKSTNAKKLKSSTDFVSIKVPGAALPNSDHWEEFIEKNNDMQEFIKRVISYTTSSVGMYIASHGHGDTIANCYLKGDQLGKLIIALGFTRIGRINISGCKMANDISDDLQPGAEINATFLTQLAITLAEKNLRPMIAVYRGWKQAAFNKQQFDLPKETKEKLGEIAKKQVADALEEKPSRRLSEKKILDLEIVKMKESIIKKGGSLIKNSDEYKRPVPLGLLNSETQLDKSHFKKVVKIDDTGTKLIYMSLSDWKNCV